MLNQPIPSAAPPPLPPPRPAPATSSVQKQRSKVVDELIHTERDFHHQVQLCVDKVIPPLQAVSTYSRERFAGNQTQLVDRLPELKSLECS